jgi:hypothetical protein
MSNGKLTDATVILNDESKMLDQLASMVEAFAKGYKPKSPADDDFEFNNLECWAKELKGYRDVNKQYASMSKSDLRSALQEEIDVLKKCRASITSQSAAAQYWKTNLSENIYYTEQTLARVQP